jgi:uncharacterized protein HemX
VVHPQQDAYSWATSGDANMKKPTNRKAVVLSAMLTALILTIAGTAVFAWDRLSATSATQTVPTPVIQPVSVPAPQTVSNNDQTLALEQANAEIAAYKAQLQQASQMLNDAYAQIDSLQAAQNQPGQGQFFGEREGGENGRIIILRGGGGG